MTKPYKYTGVLGEPHRVADIEFAASLDPENQKLQEAVEQYDEARFFMLVDALLENCGQPPLTNPALVRWDIVALKLALRHIPAFGPLEILETHGAKKRGAPRRATTDDEVDLYRKVQSQVKNGESERKAIKNAKEALRLREGLDALESRYRRVRARIEKGNAWWEQANSHLSGSASRLLSKALKQELRKALSKKE